MLIYQAALDNVHVVERLETYRLKLLAVVAGASVVTALLGWFITRRSLRPLKEITATAQRITATGLDEHIGGKAWPEELALLAVEFDRMLARLRDSFERLSQFTAGAAHEFRTPLNNLLGATSLALARPRSAEEYRVLLETNVEEYQRLTHMMDSLLFLAARGQCPDGGEETPPRMCGGSFRGYGFLFRPRRGAGAHDHLRLPGQCYRGPHSPADGADESGLQCHPPFLHRGVGKSFVRGEGGEDSHLRERSRRGHRGPASPVYL